MGGIFPLPSFFFDVFPDLDRPRVIIITAYACETYERVAEECGAYAYLPKPIQRNILLEVTQQALDIETIREASV